MADLAFHHVGYVCDRPDDVERFYVKHFGFRRARVAGAGQPDQVVFLKRDDVYLELFPATEKSPAPPHTGAGPMYPTLRHLAFKVDDVDAFIAGLGDDARITLGPLDFSGAIPGWKTTWISDPGGNIVEISQGYVDEDNPPPLR